MNTSLTKSCSFFGHRKIEVTENLIISIRNIIEKLVANGYNLFYFGGFGEFDDLCYHIVSEIKRINVNIKRVFCLMEEKHIIKKPKCLMGRDYDDYKYFYLKYDYWYTRIYYRNCCIIDNSDFVVFYTESRENSGANKALEYAKKKHKQYINLL